MAYSRTCKLLVLGGVGLAALVVLVIIYSLTSRICPNDGELMHKESSTCYPKGSKGPCTKNLIFLEEGPRSQYGECNCPYTEFNRSLLYHKETQECYFIFTQAYCSSGQWLTLKKDGVASCEENTCIRKNDEHNNVQWVPLKGGACGRLGFHEEGCPEGSVVRFHKNYILPSCHTPQRVYNSKLGSIGVPAYSCRIGSYPSIVGKCQPQFEFDFD